ncbi:hypothetical protein N752_22890 [Desulforamulus aquiferis]|nr:hypothetical protein N752_22890 [Desulforamulus aquiferis]
MIKGLKFKGKIGAAFGSYGWSGEGVKIIEEWMKESGIKIVQDGKRVAYEPTADEILECEEFGRDFSIKLNTNE